MGFKVPVTLWLDFCKEPINISMGERLEAKHFQCFIIENVSKIGIKLEFPTFEILEIIKYVFSDTCPVTY